MPATTNVPICFYEFWKSQLIPCLLKGRNLFVMEMQKVAHEKQKFVPQEKADHFQVLAASVHKRGNARKISRNNINKRCSKDRKLKIETTKKETQRVVFRRIESVYREFSKTYENVDNFRVSCFRSREPYLTDDNRVAFYIWRNLYWDGARKCSR